MPELPEVETVVRTLQQQLQHSTIVQAKVYWPNIIANQSVEMFEKLCENQTFQQYQRRGKYLVFTLTDVVMVVHLRMEGKFYLYAQPTPPSKHTHVVFDLQQGQLHYHDVRKFGKFYLYRKTEPLACLAQLGLEPFDELLTASYLKQACTNLKTPIKTKLLDQTLIAGIGNIYANEICFQAKVHPLRPCGQLSLETWQQIILATQAILAQAIAKGGTTIRSYTSSLGVTGLFQLSLKVHGRCDECDECGHTIQKIKVNQRGTYYCPNCQKEKPVTLALTGTMGSGKSAVLTILQKMGYSTISCDQVNREILQKEETKIALAAILDCQPEEVLPPLITDKIFHDAHLKKQVEQYLHERIKQQIDQFIQQHQTEQLVIIEVPLLFEAGWDIYFDYLVTVTADEQLVMQRLKKYRQMSLKQINQRLKTQKPAEEKIARSDAVIYNNGTKKQLKSAVEQMLKKLVFNS